MADTLDIPVEQRDNLRKLIFSFIISSKKRGSCKANRRASNGKSTGSPMKTRLPSLGGPTQAEAKAGTLHRGVIHAEDAEGNTGASIAGCVRIRCLKKSTFRQSRNGITRQAARGQGEGSSGASLERTNNGFTMRR